MRMRPFYLVALSALALTACAAPPASTGGPAMSRAAQGDTVWVILNHVKADKRQDFERFLHEVFWPAGRRVGMADPVVALTFSKTRILHPTQRNPDGTYTYAFIMDPRIPGANYSIEELLRRGFSQGEADRHFREGFADALARPQEQYVMVQSPD